MLNILNSLESAIGVGRRRIGLVDTGLLLYCYHKCIQLVIIDIRRWALILNKTPPRLIALSYFMIILRE